jgi:hypothetical protein
MKGKLFKPKLVYQDDRTTPPQLNFFLIGEAEIAITGSPSANVHE